MDQKNGMYNAYFEDMTPYPLPLQTVTSTFRRYVKKFLVSGLRETILSLKHLEELSLLSSLLVSIYYYV